MSKINRHLVIFTTSMISIPIFLCLIVIVLLSVVQ